MTRGDFIECLWAVRWRVVSCFCSVSAHILQRAIGYENPSVFIHLRKARRSKSHVFLPKCQGQSVPCQTNMENKPEELQLCFKTRDSFEAILAHKPWPHLSVSCYGELDAWTHINTNACTQMHAHECMQTPFWLISGMVWWLVQKLEEWVISLSNKRSVLYLYGQCNN